MIELKTLLCPVDLSGFSRHALEHAVTIARRYGGKVTALQVLPLVGTPSIRAGLPPSIFTPESVRAQHRQLTAFVDDVGAGMLVDVMVVEGSITAEIERVASELKADLLVMGTRGRSGLDRLLLGSTTEKMLRRAPCPLLAVPAREPETSPRPRMYAQVLCAVDFSPSSLRALAYAESLAAGADTGLTVLHVLEPGQAFDAGAGAPPVESELRGDASRRLHDAVTADVRTYSRVREAVADGVPYKEILREAEEDRSDLIVMGTHGGRIGLMAFGSTTNQVVRQAACPVLAVRAVEP